MISFGQPVGAQDVSDSGLDNSSVSSRSLDDGHEAEGREADTTGATTESATSLSGAGVSATGEVDHMLDASDGVEGVIKAPAEPGKGANGTADNSSLDAFPGFTDVGAEQDANATQDLGLNQGIGANQMFESAAPMVAAQAPAMVRAARDQAFGPLEHSPVVVELFTSQGCSSCPPADDMFGDLVDRPDVLALSWHVDYWDYLGWADDFARPEFTRRQKDYARAAGERSIYTPQIIVGGADTLLSLRPAELLGMINTQMTRPIAVSLSSRPVKEGYQIEMTPRAPMKRGIAIMLVRYSPERSIEVTAGENRGLEMTYRNVVLGVDQLALWDGKAPLRLTVKSAGQSDGSYPADTRHAILAQSVGRKNAPSGPILAAIKLD